MNDVPPPQVIHYSDVQVFEYQCYSHSRSVSKSVWIPKSHSDQALDRQPLPEVDSLLFRAILPWPLESIEGRGRGSNLLLLLPPSLPLRFALVYLSSRRPRFVWICVSRPLDLLVVVISRCYLFAGLRGDGVLKASRMFLRVGKLRFSNVSVL